MENTAYKSALEDALKFTGGRRLLTVSDVRALTGLVDYRTVYNHFPFPRYRGALISVYQYAAVMAGGEA